MTILQKILDNRATHLEELKLKSPSFKVAPSKPSLYEKLINQNHLQVISEIKRASPSKGAINLSIDPIQQAKLYEQAGAACISVLTEPDFFKGNYEDLNTVATTVNIPVLCKDFIIDEIQIDYSKAAGASVILLIVAALSEKRLKQLYSYACGLNLEILVEVHDLNELHVALNLNAKIIGVNNRNLKTFEVDLAHTKTIGAELKNNNVAFVSESGIHNTDDAITVARYGANAILVGEALMKSENVISHLQQLKVSIEKGSIS